MTGGRTVVLGLRGITPLQGCLPIVVDGKVIGAVGVSGVTSQQGRTGGEGRGRSSDDALTDAQGPSSLRSPYGGIRAHWRP